MGEIFYSTHCNLYYFWNPLAVDTSLKAVGFILSQLDENGKRRPARYGSIPLNDRESRYSQPKLELYGLFRALRSWRRFIIGLDNFKVEVDAKYIKGMLESPDLQPNAAMNWWIQGILLFNFTLIHVPGVRFKGPDALSRRDLAEDEEEPPEEYDDSWLDDIVLLAQFPDKEPLKQFNSYVYQQPVVQALATHMDRLSSQDQILIKIKSFHETKRIPTFDSKNAERRFLKKASQYYLTSDQRMFHRNGTKAPSLVILDSEARERILEEAHENLGHKGEQSVYELL